MKVKELIEIAEELGWIYEHTRGDHRKFKKQGKRSVTIPGKESADVPIGTAKAILRQLGSE